MHSHTLNAKKKKKKIVNGVLRTILIRKNIFSAHYQNIFEFMFSTTAVSLSFVI